jgi:hypothetical protein
VLPVGLSAGLTPVSAQAQQVPSEPFAAVQYGTVQYGTNGCLEVGARLGAADLPIAARLAPFRVDGDGQAARSRWVMVWARRKKSSWFDPLPVTPRHRTPPVDRVPLT